MIALKPHNTKRLRLTVELIALAVFCSIIVQEWPVITSALKDIKASNSTLLFQASFLYWLIVPLTAVSYLLLSPLKLSFSNLIFAVIAGSGPGRLVPGGFGLLSIATLHLQKQGLPTRLALFIGAANNFIGIVISLIVLLLSSIIHPDPLLQIIDQLPSLHVLIPLLCIVVLIIIYAIMHRSKSQKCVQQQDKSSLLPFILYVTASPLRILWLGLIALIILFGNVMILALVARATQSPISLYESIVTLSIGVLIGGIIPTPGGVGGVEIGIASALILLGFSPKDATSVAIGYRFITFFQPLIPGLLSYIYLRRTREI